MSEKQTSRTETVYHLTELDHLSSIQKHGLKPNKETHRARAYLDEILDDFRPQHLIDLGISRAGSIYAHPYLETLHSGSMSGQELDKSIALAAEVNPDAVIVLDAQKLEVIQRNLHRRDGYIPKDAIAEYWAKAIPLSKYIGLYDPVSKTREFTDWDDPLPNRYYLPEVLIPGSIGPERITWAASIVGKKAVELAK